MASSFSIVVAGLALAIVMSLPAAAAERCLSPKERRAAIARQEALPLPRAVHDVRAQLGGEIVRARLCRSDRGLVYLLTVLARDGKVSRPAVDAVNGRLLTGP